MKICIASPLNLFVGAVPFSFWGNRSIDRILLFHFFLLPPSLPLFIFSRLGRYGIFSPRFACSIGVSHSSHIFVRIVTNYDNNNVVDFHNGLSIWLKDAGIIFGAFCGKGNLHTLVDIVVWHKRCRPYSPLVVNEHCRLLPVKNRYALIIVSNLLGS